MGLESSFTYITSLNSNNPVGSTDVKSQGDEHIRGIKTVLLASFPNINAEVSCTPTELNYLDGSTPGTAVASKALVVDSNKDINLGTGDITATVITGTTVTGTTVSATNASVTGTLTADTIAEVTPAAGVTIDGLKIKDAGFVFGTNLQGDIYYRNASGLARLAPGTSGQFLRTQGSGANPTWAAAGWSKESPVTLSGDDQVITTAIASGDTEIDIHIANLTMSAASNLAYVQLGTASSWITSGYNSQIAWPSDAMAASSSSSTSGMLFIDDHSSAYTGTYSGIIRLRKIGSIWIANSFVGGTSGTNIQNLASSELSGAGTITRIRLSTSSTATFTAGSVQVWHQ